MVGFFWAFSPWPVGGCLLCLRLVCLFGCVCDTVLFSEKDTGPIELGPILMSSFLDPHLFKTLFPSVTSGGAKVGLQPVSLHILGSYSVESEPSHQTDFEEQNSVHNHDDHI